MTDTETKIKETKVVKKRIVKYIRNIAIAIVILLILLIIAGLVYTWFMGQNVSDIPESAVPKKSQTTNALKRPTVNPNAKVGVSQQMLITPIAPGSNTSMTIKTNPEAKCTITAVYDKVPSTDSGLTPKTADEYGIVSWSWTVEPSVPLGDWPVTVICANAKNSGMYIGHLVVSKNGM